MVLEDKKDIAILLFSYSYVKEHNEKKILSSFSENKLLFKSLFNHTVKEIRRTGVPYFIDTNDTQVGQSFGERLSNSVQKVFQKGYDKVIVLGSDSPDISAAIINKAVLKLSKAQSVIGPSQDGGAYLIGLTKSLFQKSGFNNLKTKDDYHYQNLRAILNSELLSEELADIDSIQDWNTYLRTAPNSQFLESFLQSPKKTNRWSYQQSLYQTIISSLFFLRGPPQVA